MAFDPYSPCLCGSGKKFKWCCQPIFTEIEKAFIQDEEGQHEVALRAMDQLVAQHPTNPEAWGRKAELLYRNQRLEEAEVALQKAFEANPNYPFGHLLRGTFRLEEGEVEGALLLFRKAADLLDPEIPGQLSNTYALIADAEVKLNRPVAAHAALRIAVHLDPSSEALRNALEGYYGPKSRLPLAARREYALQPAAGSLSGDRRSAWQQALARATTGKLSDAVNAFAELTQSDPENAAAWYNLGVTRAWRGDNRAAIEALDRYVSLEPDAEKAAAAWALAEVLRLGHGMEDASDYLEYSVLYRIKEPQQAAGCLRNWQEERKLMVIEAREDAPVFSAIVLEWPTALTAEQARARLPRLGSYLLIVQDRLRLWHTNREALDRVKQDLLAKAGAAVADGNEAVETANFSDVLSSAIVFPIEVPEAERAQRVGEEFQRYFEEGWIHQPLRALGGVPPIDAAGHPVLKKKLAGVIQFLEHTAATTSQPYEFDRLRRKLGLLAGAPAAEAKAAGPDVGGMSAAELASLALESLSDQQLEEAYQVAIKLDARDLAGKFALALVGRPAQPTRPDRYPFYSYLVQRSLSEGNTDAALDFVNEGEKTDCEQNEGRRRNDYELRRGQIHVKRGEADQAHDVFQRLIDRSPGELKFQGSAAEAMLSARLGSKALHFAEAGLKKARELNNRDSEHYFAELVEAAKRQG